uniref:HIG1 domain-containing protein n=1 Tax=Ciona intestinalis TaxID=7719 RepID=H2XY84_CIOIN
MAVQTESTKKMTKEEILKQLPDDLEDLSKLSKLIGPPSPEDYKPITIPEKKSFGGNFLQHCKDNPFVPLGLSATVLFLFNGLRHMRLGNRQQSQVMMRGRVMAQGFTIIALTCGAVYQSAFKSKKE